MSETMFNYYQKRKLRTVINSRYMQGFILLLVFSMGWSAYVRYDIAMEMTDRRIKAEEQLANLESRKDLLEEQVRYLESERGMEAEMRRQFDVALPGEQVVVIVEEEKREKEIQPLSTSSRAEEEVEWYKFWQ